jgi:hypothetical protein
MDKALISPGFPEVRRGRPPLNGVRAMTRAERNKRQRDRKNAGKAPKVPLPCPGLLPGPLTTQISNDSFVRRYIDSNFLDLKDIVCACNRRLREQGLVEQKQVHKHGVVSMLVGTAIDYRIRAYFRCDLHLSGSVRIGLALLEALPEYRKVTMLGAGLEQIETAENAWYYKRREKIAAKLVVSFRKFTADVRPERRRLTAQSEERLCRYCILFAYLDWIGRNPYGNSALFNMVCYATPNINKMLSYVDSKVVTDVVRLSRLFHERHAELIANFSKVSTGGTLTGSSDLKADFDLLVDGCLMEIKTTGKAGIATKYLRQLIGYWLLDYDDTLKIRSFGICLTRHGHTEYFDLRKDLLRGDKSSAELRKNFRTKLRKLKRAARRAISAA